MTRGFFIPVATSSTEKPWGAFGFAPSGIEIVSGRFAADSVTKGGGRSLGLIRRRTPGESLCPSPNAAEPGSTVPEAAAATVADERRKAAESQATGLFR